MSSSNLSNIVSSGRRAWLQQVLIFSAALGIPLFGAAGRLDWLPGWLYLASFWVGQLLVGIVAVPRHPQLFIDRRRPDETEALSWDRPLVAIATLYGPLSTVIVAGLDARFAWTSLWPDWVMWIAFLLATEGAILTAWALIANRHFYGYVKIGAAGQHKVQQEGPYRWIRHPGYAGGILFALFVPFLLGSWWAMAPSVGTIAALVMRTRLEDQLLRQDLPGYQQYAEQVTQRLIPGIW